MPAQHATPGAAHVECRQLSRFIKVAPGACLLFLLAALSSSGLAQSSSASQSVASPAPAAAANPYAGTETCAGCHEDIVKAFKRNSHFVVDTATKYKKWNQQACESCHGPGAKHAESADPKDIMQPAKQTASIADKTCLGCHLNQPTHVGRLMGGHAQSAVSCTSCHSIHGPAKTAALNCTQCHADTRAQFNKPHGHKLGQGGVGCVDCHNPHGSTVAQSFRQSRSMQAFAANEPGCFKCHANYRGPFTFEHAPVRNEGCASCHEPHNSVNPRMLTRHEVRFTCLECHSNLGTISASATSNSQPAPLGGVPPAFHDLRNPRFRNCTICHVKIHGSHADRDFLR